MRNLIQRDILLTVLSRRLFFTIKHLSSTDKKIRNNTINKSVIELDKILVTLGD